MITIITLTIMFSGEVIHTTKPVDTLSECSQFIRQQSFMLLPKGVLAIEQQCKG